MSKVLADRSAVPQPPRRALNPARRTSYEQALDAAMEALSLAVIVKLEDRSDSFRFAEVGSTCKVGEAIGRLKARAGSKVDDFVNPRAGPGPCVGPNPYAADPWGGVHGLGGIEPVDPLIADLGPVVGGPHGVGRGVFNARPLGRNGPGPQADDGNPFGMFRTYLDDLKATVDSKDDKEVRKFEKLNEINRLLKDADGFSDDQRTFLEGRRDEIFDSLAKAKEKRDHAKEAPARVGENDRDAAPELVARCLNPQCNAAHDRNWQGPDGLPLDCDICGGQMAWAAPVLDGAQVGPQVGAQAPFNGQQVVQDPHEPMYVCAGEYLPQ